MNVDGSVPDDHEFDIMSHRGLALIWIMVSNMVTFIKIDFTPNIPGELEVIEGQ